MPHRADFFKGLFQGRHPDIERGAGHRDGEVAGTSISTLHLLVRAQRQSTARRGYYGVMHEYEVVLWQSGQSFITEMRSRLHSRYGYEGTESSWTLIGEPWSSQRTSSSLAAARTQADRLLDDPRAAGNAGRAGQGVWYWNELNAGTQRTTTLVRYERPPGIDDGSLAEAVAEGARLPDGPAAGEVVRQLWGRDEPAARAAILQFAHAAPLTYGSWSHWKWLYKQAEETSDVGLLAPMMARLDAIPLATTTGFSWLEQPPRAATLAYMKRRARRFLRDLATRDPAGYVGLASYVLYHAGRDRSELDLACQWLSLDILYGRSRRYDQTGHGRGRYVCRRRRPSLFNADEVAPEAWSERQGQWLPLYGDPALPWQTLEWACAMVRRRGIAPPALGDAALMRFLESTSPLLVMTGAAEVTARAEAGAWPAARAAALAFYYANGSQRSRLAALLSGRGDRPDWDRDFAAALSELVSQSGAGTRFPARRLDSTVLLGSRYAALVPAETLLGLVPALLATGHAEFIPLARAVLARSSPLAVAGLLLAGGWLAATPRQTFVDLVLADLGQRRITYETARTLVLAESDWVRAAGWQLIATHRSIGPDEAAGLWEQLLAPTTPEPVLADAVGSAGGLRVLLRAPVRLEALTARLRAQPALLAALSPDAFAVLARGFPLDVIVALIPLMSDETWLRLRDRLLAELRQDGRLADFWRAVWALSPVAVAGPVALRLLDDPVVAASFAEVADTGFLDTSTAAFGPLLLGWASAHPELFPRGAQPLLTAALHKIPEVRTWALQRIAEVGLTMPFALRLLESGLPESVAAGRRYFDAVPPGAPDELEMALAICDSPEPAAQAYGRAYIAARRATLPAEELTRRLAEHPDPPMQEVVARTLLEQPDLARDLRGFDTAVLRARDRGRRPKELVKQRLAQAQAAQALDRATLLELARGKTPRDAEWALQQLARLAAAGKTVEGLTVDGVEGV